MLLPPVPGQCLCFQGRDTILAQRLAYHCNARLQLGLDDLSRTGSREVRYGACIVRTSQDFYLWIGTPGCKYDLLGAEEVGQGDHQQLCGGYTRSVKRPWIGRVSLYAEVAAVTARFYP